jgi:CubicO group peptidase (beta-lactamase class C family)
MELTEQVLDEAAAEASFSGIVTVDVGDRREVERCYGFAHRALQVPNTASTRFAVASGSKVFTALGYLHATGDRTNVLHLPVRGTGDGGIYTTAGDMHAFWQALTAGRIVSPATVAEMSRPRHDAPAENLRYGLGLWLHHIGPALVIEGYDAGVSFRSTHDPRTRTSATVVGKSAVGAWPVVRAVAPLFD